MSPEERTTALRSYEGDDKIVTSHELDIIFSQEDSLLNLRSGIALLDKFVDGFRDGEIYVISGPTKHGKTLLAQTLTVSFCKQFYYPLWFSYEVPAKQFLSQFPQIPHIYMPKVLYSHAMEWFWDRVDECFLKYHTRIIFIDHLHYLIDLGRTKNPSIDIGQIMRDLKTRAVNQKFLIFVLAHTNMGEQGPRDSSFIAQECDCLLMMKRLKKDEADKSNVEVRFHRRTGVMEESVPLQKVGGLLYEFSKNMEPPPEPGWQEMRVIEDNLGNWQDKEG
jgi:archaellum biogenesis ATPase FlaH